MNEFVYLSQLDDSEVNLFQNVVIKLLINSKYTFAAYAVRVFDISKEIGIINI